MLVWWSIGIWLDRWRRGPFKGPIEPFGNWIRAVAAIVLVIIVAVISAAWYKILSDQGVLASRSLEILSGFVVWPLIMGMMAFRTMRLGRF